MGIDKKYKLYVFDLDGTLVDTRVDIARALKYALDASGFEAPDIDQVVTAIGGGARNAVSMLTGLDGGALAPILDTFMKTYEDMCSDSTAVYEGGEALLRRLGQEGARLALVTMKSKNPTHKILETHKLDMFDDVVTFDDKEKRKPEPDILLELLKKYHIGPGDALMIGDTVTDMKFAQAAGVDACAVTFGYGVTEEVLAQEPKYSINSFLDF